LPTVPTSSGSRAAAVFDRQDALGRRRERIAAQAHRDRARVTCHALDLDEKTIRAVDCGHDADGQALRLQHGTLLDVQLGVREDVLPDASPRRRSGRDRGRTRRAPRASRCRPLSRASEELRIEIAGDRAAAEKRRAESARLPRSANADDLDGERQSRAAHIERVHALDRRRPRPSMPS
jgi:hypothetical protein